jgi:hypothetical protein
MKLRASDIIIRIKCPILRGWRTRVPFLLGRQKVKSLEVREGSTSSLVLTELHSVGGDLISQGYISLSEQTTQLESNIFFWNSMELRKRMIPILHDCCVSGLPYRLISHSISFHFLYRTAYYCWYGVTGVCPTSNQASAILHSNPDPRNNSAFRIKSTTIF